MKKLIKNLKWLSLSIILGVVIGGGLIAVKAWSEPAVAPPGGNIGAPINTGAMGQIKSGALQTNGLRNIGTTRLDGVTNCAGKLYTNASGDVLCGTDQTGGGGGGWAGTGSGTTNYITKWTGTSSIGNSQLFDNGTNVGIGTTSPSYKMDIAGTMRTTGGAVLNTSGATNGLIVQNGNVGIGTASPTQKLQVDGGAVYVTGRDTATNASIYGAYDIGTPAKMRSNQYCDLAGTTCKTVGDMGGLGGYIRISGNGNSRTPITLTCPAGYKVVSGGFSTAINNYAYESYAISDTQWKCSTYDLGCAVWSDCRTYSSTCYAVCIK